MKAEARTAVRSGEFVCLFACSRAGDVEDSRELSCIAAF